MHYLFASNATPDKLPIGFSLVAGAKMLSLEEPWASPLLARVDDPTRLDALKSLITVPMR
jgi:hypothetical protein